jgi:hypothetical protein
VAVALSLAVSKGPLGERLYTLGLWYGAVTWQSLALLAGCLIALRRPSAAAAALPHAAPAARAA